MTRLVLVLLVALSAVPAALAGYPSTFAMQNGLGVLSKDGETRFVATASGTNTQLVATGGNSLSATISGRFGIPTLRDDRPGLGMFRSGARFVLQSIAGDPRLVKATSFRVVRTSDLGVASTIKLKGIYAFDALSPNGRWMYVTQHVSLNNLMEYVVRAYDLKAHKLLPGRIADRTQKSW